MNIGPKDIILYAICGLTLALAANYYGDLNIPIINKIQNTLIPGLGEDTKGPYSYGPEGGLAGCDNAKVFGDAKRQLRKMIEAAKSQGDLQLETDLKQRRSSIEEQERQSCQ
ncbi:hypothetical protein MNBD_NITROSPINAE04-388 [hydrothermal vent metagenome]|uniref:Uncharacterized protein n=1 Tax=hydrothermal vent metagenome TaxID=652676 RepID=A0A3B1CMC1_9ZZZZ